MNPLSGVVIILMGVILGKIVGVFRVRKLPNKKFVNGEIMSIEYNSSADGESYYAYINYYVNDVAYSLKSSYASASFREGQVLRIAYNEKNPSQAMIAPTAKDYFFMLLFVLGGLIVTIIGFFK